MISKGLADHFALEVFGEPPDRWCNALDADQLVTWYTEAEKEFSTEHYDHFAWFYGQGARRFPNWAGYSLRFDIVARYMEANPSRKPSDLDSVPPDIILKDYRSATTPD